MVHGRVLQHVKILFALFVFSSHPFQYENSLWILWPHKENSSGTIRYERFCHLHGSQSHTHENSLVLGEFQTSFPTPRFPLFSSWWYNSRLPQSGQYFIPNEFMSEKKYTTWTKRRKRNRVRERFKG